MLAMKKAPLEKEFKLSVTQAQLARLRKVGVRGRTLRQTNFYFDVKPSLPFAKHGIGIRIRVENGKYILTVKFPARGRKGMHVKEEHEMSLSARTAKSFLAGRKSLSDCSAKPIRVLRKKAKALPLDELVCLGGIRNVRTQRQVGELKLELDAFTIFGKKYYEAECETEHSTRDEKALKQLWRELKIPYRPGKISKLARFLRASA